MAQPWKSPFNGFALRALVGVVVLTLLWSLVSQWLALPVGGLSGWVLEHGATQWVQFTKLSERNWLEVHTSLSVINAETGWKRGEVILDINPARYAYSFPVLVALLLAMRGKGRWERVLAGYALLLPLQVFSTVAMALIQICLSVGMDLATLGIAAWQLEVLAYAYQLGVLMVPVLSPFLLWLWLDWKRVRSELIDTSWRRSGTPQAPAKASS